MILFIFQSFLNKLDDNELADIIVIQSKTTVIKSNKDEEGT